MKRKRFPEEQIIGILAEHEAGAKCADLCRKHGDVGRHFLHLWTAPLMQAFRGGLRA